VRTMSTFPASEILETTKPKDFPWNDHGREKWGRN
jgi:hypothetical protein